MGKLPGRRGMGRPRGGGQCRMRCPGFEETLDGEECMSRLRTLEPGVVSELAL